jgi:flagellar biosynthesis/type III secretory pathway M-ring protein FliF/YscJ
MLYEPPNKKQYIIIGAAAIVLVVLIFFIFAIVSKNKTTQTPKDNIAVQEKAKQEKIQKESQRLDQIKESVSAKNYSQEEINQQSKKLDELKNKIVK